MEPPNPTQRTRKPGRGRAVRTGRGKQQQSDFGEVPPKPYCALPGGKPEVPTTASTASLVCFSFPHLPESYFLYWTPRINFLLVWPAADRERKPSKTRVATAQAHPGGLGRGRSGRTPAWAPPLCRAARDVTGRRPPPGCKR